MAARNLLRSFPMQAMIASARPVPYVGLTRLCNTLPGLCVSSLKSRASFPADITPTVARACQGNPKQLHTSSQLSAFGIHEIAEAMSHHPAIIAVTGAGGGLGVLAGLYRTPALWKLLAKASTDQSILLLPQKPSHLFQPRKDNIQKLHGMFKSLRKQHGKQVTVTVYVTGRPGYGKTQLAREFGGEFYRKNKGVVFKNLFVGTLNAASKSSFLQSYIVLAMELGCVSDVKALENLSGKKGELYSLEILSAAVRKELKRRPGWMLIIDNLSSDVKSVDHRTEGSSIHQISDYLPSIATSTVPDTSGISSLNREAFANLGVAGAYGIASHKAAWRSFWPQAGDENWGKGHVLVTTGDRRLVERSNPCASELFLRDGMMESDAITLLEKISGGGGKGAREVVNSLDRAPLSIASAGLYIAAERSRNPSYSFHDYLSGLEKGVQAESEAMLVSQNVSYPVTMTMAIGMAIQQLIEDPNLYKVFLLLATCSQSPVPMQLLARILHVQPDINSIALESVRNCALLEFPSSHSDGAVTGDGIETVSLYQGTQKVLKELLLRQPVASEWSGTTQSGLLPLDAASIRRRNDLIGHFVDCLISEYEAAKLSDSVSSYRMRYLLLPHMEALVKVVHAVPDFHLDASMESKLCHALGSGWLLIGRPNKAKEVLERALEICESYGGKETVEAAAIATTLGTTYRHLARQSESEFVLKEALEIYRDKCGKESIEVAKVLSNLGATYKHKGLYHDSRKCFEQALFIYEKKYHSNHPSVALTLTNLGAVWRNLGDNNRSKELFEKALAIQEELFEPQHPYIALTLGNLSVLYSDIGQPQKSIGLLKRALEINKSVHGPDHISVAITLSNLSIAYRHLGDVRRSKELAEEALQKTEAVHGPVHPGVAIALGVLGPTYCDLGELQTAKQLLEKSVEINQATSGPYYIGTAIAQTQLGRVTRLNGELEEAKGVLEMALETKKTVLGVNHPGIAITLKSLGKVYHELGHYTRSLVTLEQAQTISRELYHLNPKHPQIAFTEADFARVIRDCGDVDRAANVMQQAIDLYVSSTEDSTNAEYTKKHPKYASMLAIYGLIQRDLSNLKQAKSSLEKALHIQREILSEQNLMKAETMCNLGTVLHRIGDRQKALESMETALTLMNSVKREHPITATISAAIAQLLYDMGDIHSAQLSLEDALRIRTKCCTDVHPNIALYHQLLAEILQRNTGPNIELVRKHLEIALKVYKTLHERELALSTEAGIVGEIPVIKAWEENVKGLTEQIRLLS